MSELHVLYNGQQYTFAPGATVRIGRSSDNDIVVNDPTVSRRHAQISWQAGGWTWQNAGQAPTFLAGQPVAQFGIGPSVDVALASPQGPGMRLQSAGVPGQAPQPTQVAAGAPGTANAPGYAPAGAPPGGQAPGYAGAGAGYGQAGQAGQAAPGQGFPPGGVPQQGYGPGAAAPQGFAPGGTPPGMPGMPGYAGYAGQGGIPMSLLDQGSFFEILIPIKSWLHDRGLRQGLRLLIIPYALLPLIFIQVFASSSSLSTPGWAYSLYVAPIWLLAFWYLIRPPKMGWTEVAVAVAIIVMVVIYIHVITIPAETAWGNPGNVGGALVIGYAEETNKAIPVLIAALVVHLGMKKKLDPRTWFLMGTVAGLAFGVYEQAEYTRQAISIIHGAQIISQADDGILSFAFRVFVDGFQHAIWAGVSGFFIGIAINYRRRAIPLLILGISIPAVLHGFNDFSLTIFHTVWVTVLEQALSLLLFLGYTLSASTIVSRVRRNPNFRGQSIMMEHFSQPGDAAT